MADTVDIERASLSGPFLLSLARYVGAEPDAAKEAFDAALPTALYLVVDRGSTEAGARGLLNGLASGLVPRVDRAGLERALPDPIARQRLATAGEVFARDLLGARTAEVLDALSSYGGVGRTGAMRLLSLATPLAMELVAQRIRQANLDAPALTTFLSDERIEVGERVPTLLRPPLGLAAPEGAVPRRSGDLERERIAYDEDANLTSIMTVEDISRRRFVPYVLAAAMIMFAIAVAITSTGSRAKRLASLPPPRRPTIQPLEAPTPAAGDVTLRSDSRAVHEIELAASRSVTLPQRFSLDGVQFAEGRTVIPPQALPIVRDLSAVLKAHPGARIRIEGHGDFPSRPGGVDLSRGRAEAIKRDLVRDGASADQIEIATAPRPVVTNTGEAGRGGVDVVLLSR